MDKEGCRLDAAAVFAGCVRYASRSESCGQSRQRVIVLEVKGKREGQGRQLKGKR